MARTAHRTLIISAAFALASWALVAGAPALAAAPPENAGPSLPPAEYKPLPVGTVVTYDTWSYTVTKSDGNDQCPMCCACHRDLTWVGARPFRPAPSGRRRGRRVSPPAAIPSRYPDARAGW